MRLRAYDPHTDREAVTRIWQEIGWIGKEKREEEALHIFIGCSRAQVAEVNGHAECLVLSTPATIRYLDQDLSLSAVTSVTTSRIARKQGLARRLTALTVAADAAEGAMVSGLGMFEQGYYNQLGFGTGGYEHRIAFDPAQIRVQVQARVPRRITREDWAGVHAARLARMRGHGSCNLWAPDTTRAEMLWSQNGFGLGYYDGPGGTLTHHLWFRTKDLESGPYYVEWLSYQTYDQFLELMALIRNLGDQVRLVRIREPKDIQMQDMIKQPFKQRQVSEKSSFESRMRASAYWQMRICDLPGCLAATHLRGAEVRFNLALSDPIERSLPENALWRGIAGGYVVTLGPSSSARPGTEPSLPTVTASTGALTRMWLGVRPATGLAVTDRLSGPPGLLKELDWALRLPDPKPDWDF